MHHHYFLLLLYFIIILFTFITIDMMMNDDFVIAYNDTTEERYHNNMIRSSILPHFRSSKRRLHPLQIPDSFPATFASLKPELASFERCHGRCAPRGGQNARCVLGLPHWDRRGYAVGGMHRRGLRPGNSHACLGRLKGYQERVEHRRQERP